MGSISSETTMQFSATKVPAVKYGDIPYDGKPILYVVKGE